MGALLRAFWGIIPITAIALPYALLCWPLLAARRRRRNTGLSHAHASATAAVDVLAVTIGALVLCLVTMPVGTGAVSTLDLVPGADLSAALSDDGSLWQVVGNLLLLCPLGALVPVRVRRLRSVGRVAVTALSASVLVEATQFLIHTGRVTSTDDVLLNTIGATLGAVLTRRGWRYFDVVVPVVAIPQQVRRTVCNAPVRLRVPRSVWDARYAGIGHPERR
ncbi:VanZ family protein [Amycolatopsis rhabdoformis]|uniref:VanZ family protein n=1 Tax=Amycolatopsis rhabdoformis TaxID=1448059 RepID=A0ABZ1I0X5_9PSEU|nr:VanZ family protein [Amycolatopsis rhabdoformis]WSE28033.1 VanZ family protein [Amycolatopsis rhabdoformis]